MTSLFGSNGGRRRAWWVDACRASGGRLQPRRKMWMFETRLRKVDDK